MSLEMIEDRLTEEKQIEILGNYENTTFSEKLIESSLFPLKPTQIEIFQVNLGKMCNQTCQHCHVDAGPDRKEIMSKDTMQLALNALDLSGAKTVDLTGGAPEMNPDFYWFVEEVYKRNVHIMVRSNLTILETRKHYDAPQFFADHKIEVVSSLPFYEEHQTDIQRGDGVFKKSINALQRLNDLGYGKPDSDLKLNLVYNPVGAYLPPDQKSLEKDFKRELLEKFGIEFNALFCITNMPISRYLEYLIKTDNYEDYMDLLVESYNPSAAENVMCRNTVSIGWDGYLFDCDFNQMLGIKVEPSKSQHLKDWNTDLLKNRSIALANHCYGCTAGSGSSCGGTLE